MQKRVREMKRVLEEAASEFGFEVGDPTQAPSGHLRWPLKRKSVQGHVMTPVSPSDHRILQNLKRHCKHKCRYLLGE